MGLLGIAGLGAFPILRVNAETVGHRVASGSVGAGSGINYTQELSVTSGNAISCSQSCDLWAQPGSVAVGTDPALPTWSYSTTETGVPGALGPTIVATAGDILTINLHNRLPVSAGDTALSFPRFIE
jgi:FtsP/CotA-like multicopper oxidase with cupredoxin domain